MSLGLIELIVIGAALVVGVVLIGFVLADRRKQ